MKTKIGLFDFLKAGVEIIVSVGTGIIVGRYTGKAVKGSKGLEKVCSAVAAMAIEGVIASKASGYLTDQIDMIQSKIEGRNCDDDEDDDEEYEEDEEDE